MNKKIWVWLFIIGLSKSLLLSAETKELVVNGGFEKQDKTNAGQPESWDKPDGLGVKWVKSQGHGKIITMNTAVSEADMVKQWKLKGITDWNIPKPAKGPIAATYGLSFYSANIKVKEGQPYRVSFDFKGPKAGAGAKLWVRGYGMFRGKLRRRYETIVNCRVKDGEWTRFSQVFHPTKRKTGVTEMKVMLYAYWPVGIYSFDNISIVPISLEEYTREYEAALKN
jgi:hypothetical protein